MSRGTAASAASNPSTGSAPADSRNDADYTLEVDIRADGWADFVPSALIDRAAAAVAAHVAGMRGEIGFILADDAFIQALNRDHRGQDKPTNVLSFPIGPFGPDDRGPVLLGDIVLALETVKAEAAAQDKTVPDHAGHLIVHGLLHLLGHDHQDDGPAAAMEALERTILREIGIADPYAELDGETRPGRRT
jgi:probable rRNA maturation factor